MAKKARPLTRQQALKAVASECRERGWFFPSIEYNNPIRPSHQYGSQCHTKMQRILHLSADRLLREDGFFAEAYELRAWLAEPENKSWFEAANPDAITADGHLAASHAFY
jgi:hypothetical protein